MKGKNLTVQESIRIEAYLLSEKAGHPAGLEHYFWTEARSIVHARANAVTTAVKKAAAKPAAKSKTATKPASNGQNGKDHQLSLGGEMVIPSRNRPLKK